MTEPAVAVLGAGSWGTALACLLGGKGQETFLWGHRREHVRQLAAERQNRKYLPGVSFPEPLQVIEDLAPAVNRSAIVCMAVPSQQYRSVFQHLLPVLPDEAVVVSAAKGIENSSLLTMCQVMEEEIQAAGAEGRVTAAVLTGPSFAREVAQNMPTAVTVGCRNEQTADRLQRCFSTDCFRVYTSSDVMGLEISGAFKNIIAIATGICDGLDYGLNTRAALITRGLAEISRLGRKMGADPLTFSGLSGMGDLILTCTGDLSRNRSVGLELGKGRALEDILADMEMVAEGVKTTLSGYRLAKKEGIEMPILEQVYQILYQDKEVKEAVRDLLAREARPE